MTYERFRAILLEEHVPENMIDEMWPEPINEKPSTMDDEGVRMAARGLHLTLAGQGHRHNGVARVEIICETMVKLTLECVICGVVEFPPVMLHHVATVSKVFAELATEYSVSSVTAKLTGTETAH